MAKGSSALMSKRSTFPVVSEEAAHEVVERGYDQVTQAYAGLELEGRQWPRMRKLRELLAEVPEGGTVLDVGCGNGIPSMRMIQERHQGVGVDISSAQLNLARKNAPGATFLHSSIMDSQFGPDSFDAIVSFYSIEHLPREQHGELFCRFAGWLRPGGRLLFTLEPYDQPGETGTWLGVPMFFSHFDPDTTERLLIEAGFSVTNRSIETQLEGDREIDYVWHSATKTPVATR
jgi:cyclopropane fatty-acyl-phospholipid synthase-like methyltransferase